MIPLPRPIICVVTPGTGPSPPVLDAVVAAARAGATLVQVRERHLDDRALLAFVRTILEATAGTRLRVLVNERADVAAAAGAHGVHLRGTSVPASRVKALMPAPCLVGRSVHSLDDARRAYDDGGCDYLVFGTVFPSASKPPGHRAAGVAALAEVCGVVPLPIVAIGGITVANAPEIARAGAAGIAAIRLFADPGQGAGAAIEIARLFDTCS